MGFLLDTNIVSELRKGSRCSRAVRLWYDETEAEDLFMSVIVFGELRCGIEKLRPRDSTAAHALEQWMRSLKHVYSGRILPVTLDICDQWGHFSALQNLPPADGLLAATAKCHGLTVVTRNENHFQRIGVDYFSPFEA